MKRLFVLSFLFGCIGVCLAQKTQHPSTLDHDLQIAIQSLNSDHQLIKPDGSNIPYNISMSGVSVNLDSCLLTWKQSIFLGALTQHRISSFNIRDINTINTVLSSHTKTNYDPIVYIVQIKMMPNAATTQVVSSNLPDGTSFKETQVLHPNVMTLFAPTEAQADDISAKLLQATLTNCRAAATPPAPVVTSP